MQDRLRKEINGLEGSCDYETVESLQYLDQVVFGKSFNSESRSKFFNQERNFFFMFQRQSDFIQSSSI